MAGFFPFPPPRNHSKNWLLYFVGSIASYVGFAMVLLLCGGLVGMMDYADLKNYLGSRASQNWSATTGQITSSWARPGSKGFQPLAFYTYAVDGKSYNGDRVAFSADPPRFETKDEALKLLAPFGEIREEQTFPSLEGVLSKESLDDPIRMQHRDRGVTVFFDPTAPENSTLIKDFYPNRDLWMNLLSIPLCIFIIAIWVVSVREWIPYIKNKEYQKAGRSRLPQ